MDRKSNAHLSKNGWGKSRLLTDPELTGTLFKADKERTIYRKFKQHVLHMSTAWHSG
jgi:hypothetical protein